MIKRERTDEIYEIYTADTQMDKARFWQAVNKIVLNESKRGQVEAVVKKQNGVQELFERFIDAISDLLYNDPHHWSERPCGTCKAITSIIKKPFGCYKYAEKNKKN